MNGCPLPDPLPGEDRAFGAGLYVDLIPRSCWFTNVRSAMSPADWDRVRTMVYGRVGYQCETCGEQSQPGAGRLDAHERWDYQPGRVQRLTRLLALCKPCHEATHYGLAEVRGRGEQASAHLAAVNRWTPTQVHAHITEAFHTWQTRSRHPWTLDLSILTDAGITPTRPTGDVDG